MIIITIISNQMKMPTV